MIILVPNDLMVLDVKNICSSEERKIRKRNQKLKIWKSKRKLRRLATSK